MTPVLLLEEYFLTRLHVDWAFPTTAPVVEVKETRYSFDYDVANHVKDPRRRMLKFRAEFQELDAKQNKVGHKIECEMVGFLALTEATPKDKEELMIRVNGVSLLYGALRGILTTMTGVFPGGRFSLPTIMPQEIVNEVESRKAASATEEEPSNARQPVKSGV